MRRTPPLSHGVPPYLARRIRQGGGLLLLVVEFICLVLVLTIQLQQVLITCLFPDTPRAANALLSFNNQKAQKAIPGTLGCQGSRTCTQLALSAS